jgi:extradiol dioxygenase family protein
LLIFSDVQVVSLKDGDALARRYDVRGCDTVDPAITWRKCGKGFAAWFAFDVPKTIWILHQGRPIQDYHEGQGYSKNTKLQVIGDHSRRVLYSDEIVFLLQNMLARRGQPFIYQIPPDAHGRSPDALFFWSGDEYFGPTELSIKSSDWMRGKGLPYHVNIGIERTPGKGDGHPMTREELKHIQDNGHEVSLYYMLYDDDNYDITPERIKKQSDMFVERFGFRPVCTLPYNCCWKGWAEPARWMAAAGGKADNSFFSFPYRPYDHPSRNSPYFGFAQGTGYPFFFWDDAEHNNERIPFIEEPVVCYELGHRALGTTNRPHDTKTSYSHEVHAPIDVAAEYHLALNFFYHQQSITNNQVVREAIEEILRYVEYRGINVLHLGANAAAEWWFARSAAQVENVVCQDDTVNFSIACDYTGGIVVKALLKDDHPPEVTCDDQPAKWEIKKDFCGNWVYVTVPAGRHQIGIRGVLNQ